MTQTKPETFAKDPNFFFVVATSSTFGRRAFASLFSPGVVPRRCVTALKAIFNAPKMSALDP